MQLCGNTDCFHGHDSLRTVFSLNGGMKGAWINTFIVIYLPSCKDKEEYIFESKINFSQE